VTVHPDQPEPGVVLAAVKHASRRLRRWPAAMLDRSCARHRRTIRSGQRNGPTSRTEKHSKGGQFPLSPRGQFLMSLDTRSAASLGLIAQVGSSCSISLTTTGGYRRRNRPTPRDDRPPHAKSRPLRCDRHPSVPRNKQDAKPACGTPSSRGHHATHAVAVEPGVR
jgi:hypothetical protein